MGIKYTKKIVFLILCVLLISFNSNPSAQIQIIPMEQIGEDVVGDEGLLGFDIVSLYAASFDGLLMLTVVYQSLGEWELYSNITLRNSLEDLYLIQAASGEFNHFVGVYGATSLEDDSLNTEDGRGAFYTEVWRVHTNFTEITFFVDWDDIGGEGPVDLVVWTGRPLDNPDKLPDTGHLSFNGVNVVDTIGYLEDPDRNSTTVIASTNGSGPNNTRYTTTTVTEDTEVTVINTDTDNTINLPLSNLYIVGLMIAYLGYQRKRK